MAKIGSDWLYIGLGIGAVYLVYKLTSPVTKLAETVQTTATDVVNTTTKAVSDTASNISDRVTGQQNPTTAFDWFTASIPTLFNKAFDGLQSQINILSNKNQSSPTYSENISNYATGKTDILTTVANNKNVLSGSLVVNTKPTYFSSSVSNTSTTANNLRNLVATGVVNTKPNVLAKSPTHYKDNYGNTITVR